MPSILSTEHPRLIRDISIFLILGPITSLNTSPSFISIYPYSYLLPRLKPIFCKR